MLCPPHLHNNANHARLLNPQLVEIIGLRTCKQCEFLSMAKETRNCPVERARRSNKCPNRTSHREQQCVQKRGEGPSRVHRLLIRRAWSDLSPERSCRQIQGFSNPVLSHHARLQLRTGTDPITLTRSNSESR